MRFKQALIDLGYKHPELRHHLRAILASHEVTASLAEQWRDETEYSSGPPSRVKYEVLNSEAGVRLLRFEDDSYAVVYDDDFSRQSDVVTFSSRGRAMRYYDRMVEKTVGHPEFY